MNKIFSETCCASVVLVLIAILISGCSEQNSESLPAVEYVGRERCVSCHEHEASLFTGSDHDRAMAHATDETVFGDFDNSSFTHFGKTSSFFKRNGKFMVRTEGPDGKLQDFVIKYTFGVFPLQQYLVEFPGGRLQCLPLCWDTRPAQEGGQRWFHIYDDEKISHNDILHWTRVSQNWNTMCAECHSTNLQKNYDSEKNAYNTTWSEIDVSCEACHGAGSVHVALAEKAGGNATGVKGFSVDVQTMKNGAWVMNQQTGNAELGGTKKANQQVDMCGRCHSHRSAVSENYQHDKPLSESYKVSLLDETLYFPDGQIKEEVYVYGSFLQSKMHQEGVVCTDCHNAHSGKVIVQGNGLCARCHAPEKYDSTNHHFHKNAQVQCVDCHMPERTYMVVDDRRDHSLQVPRPDLSAKLNTPNACNQCHENKSVEWTAGYFKKWYPERVQEKHFGETFATARKSDPSARRELYKLILDQEQLAIIRASAVSLLANYITRESANVIRQTIQDNEPMVHSAALDVLAGFPAQYVATLAEPMLQDSSQIVRLSAAHLLAVANSNEKVFTDYKVLQEINADFPAAHVNLAEVYIQRGDYTGAKSELQKAIAIEPLAAQPYVNLADIYRLEKNDVLGKELLLKTLKKLPNDASLHHAIGLLYTRLGQPEKSLSHLKLAAEKSPANFRLTYIYAIALNSNGSSKQAIMILEKLQSEHPNNVEILQALVVFCRDAGRTGKAKIYSQKYENILRAMQF